MRACLLGAVIVGWVAGCYPATELQRARVVQPGQVRVALGARWQSHAPWESSGELPYPAPDVGVRVGVAQDVDVGLRVTLAAAELGTKLQIVDDGTVSVAVAPALMWARDLDDALDEYSTPESDVDVLTVRVPVFASVRVSEHVEPWIAPAVHVGGYTSNEFQPMSPLLALGCALGVDIKIARWLTLQPQVGLLVPVAGPTPVVDASYDSIRLSTGDYRFSGALNFYFDTGED